MNAVLKPSVDAPHVVAEVVQGLSATGLVHQRGFRADVVHALWIPNFGGKVDMIPGRVNRLTFQATRAGVVEVDALHQQAEFLLAFAQGLRRQLPPHHCPALAPSAPPFASEPGSVSTHARISSRTRR